MPCNKGTTNFPHENFIAYKTSLTCSLCTGIGSKTLITVEGDTSTVTMVMYPIPAQREEIKLVLYICSKKFSREGAVCWSLVTQHASYME